MDSQQKQKAGDNSQQIQADTVIIHNGIDEKRAREIFVEEYNEMVCQYTQEARVIAEQRNQLFANDLMPKMIKENLLDALKDPSVQILLSKAQTTAAETERPVDYSLLSELLIHRIKKGSDRNAHAGISRAVEIVDEISDEALLGLTVVHSLTFFIPATGNIADGINVLANLFSKVIYNKLPSGTEWLDHLDILDALRVNHFGKMKKTDKFLADRLSGYVDIGIDKTSDDFQQALELLRDSKLPLDLLTDHELRSGYSRLRIQNINQLDTITIFSSQQIKQNGQLLQTPVRSKLSDEQKEALKNIYALYKNEPKLKTENITEFFRILNTHESLKQLATWWDTIPVSFVITAVGRVLAHANVQRCDPTLPPLD